MKSISDVIKEYPFATLSTFMGIISLCILGLIYVGAFDMFVPVSDQGKGLFNFMASTKTPQTKNIIDYLNIASVICAVFGLAIALVSRLKQEDKMGYSTALIACSLPLIIQYYLIMIVVILVVAVIFNLDSIIGTD
jgi:hypothetical protein